MEYSSDGADNNNQLPADSAGTDPTKIEVAVPQQSLTLLTLAALRAAFDRLCDHSESLLKSDPHSDPNEEQ